MSLLHQLLLQRNASPFLVSQETFDQKRDHYLDLKAVVVASGDAVAGIVVVAVLEEDVEQTSVAADAEGVKLEVPVDDPSVVQDAWDDQPD